jgi:hypothetical protein
VHFCQGVDALVWLDAVLDAAGVEAEGQDARLRICFPPQVERFSRF